MKKALLGLLALAFVASAAMASATNVTISGNLKPALVYSSASGSKPWLGFVDYSTSDITVKADPVDDVVTEATLRLAKAGSASLLYQVSTTINDLSLSGLSLKIGKYFIPFTECRIYLLYLPGTAAWVNRAEAAVLTYTDPAYTIAGGVFNYGAEGCKSGVIKASTTALLEGLYLSAAVKSEADIGARVNTLAVAGNYQLTDLIVDAEYVIALNGDTKPAILLVGAAYQLMADLLGSIRYENYKESATDYIVDGGLVYDLRQGTKLIGEVSFNKPITGDNLTTYTLGLNVTF